MLLSMAHSFAIDNNFTTPGVSDVLPIGYPYLVGTLEKTGVTSSTILIALNLMFLFVSLLALDSVAKSQFKLNLLTRLLLSIVVLLNFNLVKYTTLPQSELLFLALSTFTLWALCSLPERLFSRVIVLFVSGVLAYLSIKVRTIGIVLVPTLLFAALMQFPIFNQLPAIKNNRTILFTVLFLLVLVAIFTIATQTSYINIVPVGGVDNFSDIISHLVMKLSIFSQIFLNIPNSIIGANGNAHFAMFSPVIMTFVIIGYWQRLKKISVLEIYTLGYVGLIIFWPFYQSRFWLPILPFLYLYAFVGVRKVWELKSIHLLSVSYLSWILISGSAALGYSTWLTFSGAEFQNRYGGPGIKKIYRAAMSKENINALDQLDKKGYEILLRYEQSRTKPIANP